MPEKKRSIKSKKVSVKVPPPSLVNVTVQDCMVWPEPRAKGTGKGNANNGPTSQVYRSVLVHKLDDEERRLEMTAPPPARREDGTAIEALRGWPGSRTQAEEEALRFQLEREAYLVANVDPKPGGKQKGKKNGKKDASKEELENVFIGDLIHQRYLNEHLEKRRRETEREQRRLEAKASAARTGRRTAGLDASNIMSNRTSQLRAIALAGKVETSPMDLWKMPRFTKGVNPRLATLRGCRRGGAEDGSGVGCDGGCACNHDEGANYVDPSEEEILGGGGDSP